MAALRQPDDPYTVVEFARKQRISLTTARKWVAEGVVPSYRIGRQYRIPATAVDEIRRAAAATTTDDLDAYIRELLDAAPRLSVRQINKLTAIIGGRGSPDD